MLERWRKCFFKWPDLKIDANSRRVHYEEYCEWAAAVGVAKRGIGLLPVGGCLDETS